jgi:hypothetical protein
VISRNGYTSFCVRFSVQISITTIFIANRRFKSQFLFTVMFSQALFYDFTFYSVRNTLRDQVLSLTAIACFDVLTAVLLKMRVSVNVNVGLWESCLRRV